jgi:hypothetical protein
MTEGARRLGARPASWSPDVPTGVVAALVETLHLRASHPSARDHTVLDTLIDELVAQPRESVVELASWTVGLVELLAEFIDDVDELRAPAPEAPRHRLVEPLEVLRRLMALR